VSDIYALDLETSATDPSMRLHAGLEPWRYRQGKAIVTSIAVCRPDDSVFQIEHNPTTWMRDYYDMLWSLQGKVVYCHNAPFDTAWMIALTQKDRMDPVHELMRGIKWRDTSLICKWLINGQLAENSRFSYALVNLAQTFLPDHPLTKEFVEMKNAKVAPGENPEYWLRRGHMDALITRALAEFFQGKLPAAQRVGYLTECDNILPVANSWITGIRIDQTQLRKNETHFLKVRADAAKTLGINQEVFTSPKQLANYLYNVLQFPITARTPTGGPSTAGDTVKWLHYKMLQEHDERADKLKLIMEAKEAATLYSKYVKSMYEALEHTGDGYIYPAPRIFGTYTGRFTYSGTVKSKDFDNDEKESRFKVSIAAHQIPRKDKMIRSSLCAPPGCFIYEADAAGQESRLIALRAKDETMLGVFARGQDLHVMTGSSIIGMEYNEFYKCWKAEGNEGGYYTEQRQLGKLTNLSCNYRIGGKALADKAYIDYDTFMEISTGVFLVKTFVRTYEGIPEYWENVIWEAKQQGYTEAFGGRRYKLTEWSRYRWMTESSAINVPIQGAGGSMKEIAIKETFEKVPKAIFCLDLHDASFFFVKEEDRHLTEQLDAVLNDIEYETYWGFKPCIPLPYDSKFGLTFAEVK
jgi:DNA polymerase I-like protein with 3'-5' exonuclease and polymerase domains